MSRPNVRRYLVAYDIPCDPRRSRLARVLQQYGDRVQYSVFVIDITPARLEHLRAEIDTVVLPSHDSVLICDLGAAEGVEDERFTWVGRRVTTLSNNHFIV